jgi:hypothetical protein
MLIATILSISSRFTSSKSISSENSRRSACGPASSDISTPCARVLSSTAAATGRRSVS